MLLLAVAGGLLLGGNAIAVSESSEETEATVTSTSDEVQSYEEQARSLAKQVEEFLNSQISVEAEKTENSEKTELSQEKLDAIEVQVKDISAKTEVLKAEVEKFVAIRTITQQIASLKGEVENLKMAEQSGEALTEIEVAAGTEEVTDTEAATETAPEVAAEAETVIETAPVAEETPVQTEAAVGQDVEGQIAAIKQQIKDLTAEYEVQKTAEEQQVTPETESVPEVQCEGGVCSANINIGTTEETATTETATNKGFWQSVSDFLKNLFTF